MGEAALVSSLSLVDLAGVGSASASSRRSKKRRAEGGYINKSLLTLSHIILKLSDAQSSGGDATPTSSHLPYRDSKLTRILKPALDGHSMMSIICTMTPSAVNFGESLNTLKFASRAKRIVSRAIVNRVDDETALIIKYQTEIAKLKSELSLAQQEAKRVQQQQQLQKQQQQRPKRPPRPLLSREDAMKNRELRNALKQAIENIGRVILNSKQSQHYQTSTAASRIRRRQGQRRKRRGESGRASSSSSSSSSFAASRPPQGQKSTGSSRGGAANSTQQTAGDEQEQQRGNNTSEATSAAATDAPSVVDDPSSGDSSFHIAGGGSGDDSPSESSSDGSGSPTDDSDFLSENDSGDDFTTSDAVSWRARRHGFSSAPPTPFRRRA